jgi:FkbM family methyltransferase
MKKYARYFYHIAKNLALKNYRYFRITGNESGTILFFDRDRKKFFSVKSRGFIDSVTANQIYSNNEYNFAFIGRTQPIQDRYDAILSSGRVPVIIDCGANIGLSAQYFARNFPKARIIGIEPSLENFKAAQANCAAFANISLHHAAIGSKPGFVAIEDAAVDANAFQVARVDAGEGIAVRTIPDIFAEQDNAELFIVKVDIEGFERDLFSSNIGWIAACDVLIVELHDWMLPGQASSGNFLRAVSAYDRDFLFKGESVFSIRNGR